MSALAADQLKRDLNTDITDPKVLAVVTSRLDDVLRNEPGNSWQDYISKAKEPSAGEFARFHAHLACDDTEGHIANSMAGRTIEFEKEHLREGYAKPFASALLDENCKGGEALTCETRAALKNLVSAPE